MSAAPGVLHRRLTYAHTRSEACLAREFRDFADRQCRGRSPLYADLAEGVAADPELLTLAGGVALGQPAPNLLLGVIHWLLLRNAGSELAAFYPSVAGDAVAHGDPVPALRSFCLTHRDEILELTASRSVTTNEVGRCAVFLPALYTIASSLEDSPIHFVDIGASLGLGLLWDRLQVQYTGARTLGPADAAMVLQADARGVDSLLTVGEPPRGGSAVGIELADMDVACDDDVDWVDALIWPEAHERRARFQRAVSIARRSPPRILRGDARALLEPYLSALPAGEPACVLLSFVGYQMFPTTAALTAWLDSVHRGRPMWVMQLGNFGHATPRLLMARYGHAPVPEHTFLTCDTYGEWIGPSDTVPSPIEPR
jgi:hypothetical protein